MRYMKSFIYSLIPLLMTLGLVGCQQDRDLTSEPTGTAIAPVKVVITESLRATGTDENPVPTPALDREKKVETLYAVAYHENGAFYNVFECQPVAGSEGAYTFDMKAEGKFQFHLVANPDAALLQSLKSESNVIADLDRIVVKHDPGADNTATNFILTSDRVEVTTAKATEATTTPSVVKLERLSARFDFLNRVPKLKITKITFKKRMVESHLFARTDISALKSTDDKVYDSATGLGERQCVAAIYGYENPAVNDTYFVIEGTFNGKEIKPYEIRLENLTVKRNHLYTIIINPQGGAVEPGDPQHGHESGKLPLSIKVIDWQEGETLSKAEADMLVATYVDHSASIANASFMDPYLTQSPSEIYTVTKDATTVELKVGTYINPGSIEIEGMAPAGVSIAKKGTATKEADGKFIQAYTLTLPKQDKYADLAQYFVMSMQGRDEAAQLDNFLEIKLIAKGPYGDDIDHFVVRHGRMKTPLEHLSEGTLTHAEGSAEPNGFNTSHKATEQNYFEPLALCKYFIDNGKKWKYNNVEYHVPIDQNEWRSIFPKNLQLIGKDAIAKRQQYTHNVISLAVHPRMVFFNTGSEIGPVPFVNKSDYGNSSDGKVAYALSFKSSKDTPIEGVPSTDGSMLVAYRYEWVGTFTQKPGTNEVSGRESGEPTDPNCHLLVTTRFLGKGFKGSIYDISKEEFWNKDNSQDATRKFPYAGVDWTNFKVSVGTTGQFPTLYQTNKDYDHIPMLQLRGYVAGAEGVGLIQYGMMKYPFFLFTDQL